MYTADMNLRIALILWLVNFSLAQDANCDFYQNVQAGYTYYLYNPNYPRNYSAGVQCRWIAVCPTGYNCRLVCSEISMPQSPSCSLDRLLVSRGGDPQLAGAETYCGRGSLNIVSTGQRISVGLITSYNSPGGSFNCELTAKVATPTPSCSCGERRQMRIVGGQQTGVNEYKMMVGLVDRRIVQIKCGAVLISNRHSLTAAHCVINQSINDFAIVVGEHDVTTGDSPATRAYRIAQFIVHPLFTDVNYDYDLGIVVSNETIVFSELVGPACLPFKYLNNDFAGSKVTVLGWGTLSPGGPNSKVLMKVNLDVQSQSWCKARVSSLTDRQICTYTPGKDACQDDSGGPLLYSDPSTGLLFSVGIVSYGRFCASSEPGINTKITALINWIVANTQPQSQYCVK